ncbi:MAG TPA: hypothetical protein VEL03_20090, partial [Streptosporangiaceae bacterium]|nr:hypothetical protein [Streptosporangiaceae bacterium]
AGALLRLITMLGFPPAIWYGGDSVSYVSSGLHLWPGTSRESGYGVFLGLLQPFHSFVLVTLVQHLSGLAVGLMIYSLLRSRYLLPSWGATLATVPALLDPYVIQLEQEILADCLFTFMCVAALILSLRWPGSERPWWSMPAAAMLLGVAAAFWPVGLPLLIVLLVFLATRWVGWRTLMLTVLAGALPLVAYLGWFDARYNQLAFNDSDGVFLWSRTMSFAECSIIKPPADLRPLCPTGAPSSRQAAPFYIWDSDSLLYSVGSGIDEFTRERNSLAEKFAIKAIEAQPLAYANVVVRGWLLSYSWNRPDVPSAGLARRYQFSDATQSQNTLDSGVSQARPLSEVQRQYTGGQTAATRKVQPFASIMIGYQRYIYVRGTMLGLLMLIGMGGIVRSWLGGGLRRRRDWGGPALLPFAAALTMEIVPPLTADFSLRYVVPTIPVICLTAALALARPLGWRPLRPVRRPALASAPPRIRELASARPAEAITGSAGESTDQGGNTTS